MLLFYLNFNVSINTNVLSYSNPPTGGATKQKKVTKMSKVLHFAARLKSQ